MWRTGNGARHPWSSRKFLHGEQTSLIETIASCVQEKHIDGVADIRDESDRDGLRIVLELQRDGDADLVLRKLYRRTQLQTTFGVINLALVNQHPEELPITDMLSHFLEHRRDVVRRRTQFRLDKALARAHIVEGLVKALDMIDRVIAIIRGAQTVQEAKDGLVSNLGFSDTQAQAILDMRLQRLTVSRGKSSKPSLRLSSQTSRDTGTISETVPP